MSQQHKTFFNIRLLLTHTHKNHPNINDIRINCCDCCLFCGIKRVGLTGRLGPQCVLLGARPSRLYSVMSSLALRARHGSDSCGPNGKKTRILHLTNCIWVNAAAESHGRLMINTPLPQLSAPCVERRRGEEERRCAHIPSPPCCLSRAALQGWYSLKHFTSIWNCPCDTYILGIQKVVKINCVRSFQIFLLHL